MKKALDQTVRDLKREVNKKVLKVSSIEQKTLDATSNETWGPRGSLIAEIAQASFNYNYYQLIMAVIWKRMQDTGKNWRHVYKALSVLEYLVIYGSERVIDDIKEHAYQISTLSDFLYTDSNGRDQGSNVRRKSQSLVALVNNKERLQEVRNKALFNKDNRASRPPLSSSARYNDGHFEGDDGNREDGLVRERDLVFMDKDRYPSGGDKYSQGQDQHAKDNDEFYSRDDNYRVRPNGDYQYRPRSQSVGGHPNNSLDESDGGRDNDSLRDERIDAPPSYEEATNDACSDVQNDKGTVTASMQKASSPSGPKETSRGTNQAPASVAGESAQTHEKAIAFFDEFDPRGPVSAAPTVPSSGLELDIFGLSAVDHTDSSASMHATSTSIPEDDMFANSGLVANFTVASTAHYVSSEPDQNPFGDVPFKAISGEDLPSETNTSAFATSQAPSGFVSASEINLPIEKKMEPSQSYNFGNTFGGPIYAPDVVNDQPSFPDFYASEFSAANSSKDILDGILPWTGPVASASFQETQPAGQIQFLSQQGFSAYSASHAHNSTDTDSSDLQIGQINPFEQPKLSNHLTGQANPFACQVFQQASPSANEMNSTDNSVPVSLHPFQPASLNGMLASHMISMDKKGLPTSKTTSITLHAGQSTAPANYQGLQINQSQQQNLQSQAIPLSSRIDSHMSQINNLNQLGPLAPQTLQLASGPFQAVQFSVPVNEHVESAQLNPLQHPMVTASQSLSCTPISSQPFQSSDPTIIHAPPINLQPFRPVASTSLHGTQIAFENIPVFSQAAQKATPSNIQTNQPSFTHSAVPDLIISAQGSAKPQPSKKKFEPKSAVWADSISRGLVNVNISGSKTNHLADIGIDFDDINRKEKRKEVKSSQTPLPSSLAMGRAMGAGSGLGRVGTGSGLFTQPLNPTPGVNAGLGMNRPYMGMGMVGNMGMMHPSSGMPHQQGPGLPGAHTYVRGGYS
ncbi:clathrin interactor EPSIN 3 isoform X1 [Dendrobium catenatum]|uniref:Clathrin interactor EPSIN 2 n=2 Tax=Dendrobium catenatum TaxID=906689 RepID=A0A2I0VDM3_9ASPA|nr:clathrin interactor EPSIN 3 isoform X1 [Dendrobium catenatum]PKU61505.1 Clathrin interactor EPSIN 2 [Dendrobium catenatum]